MAFLRFLLRDFRTRSAARGNDCISAIWSLKNDPNLVVNPATAKPKIDIRVYLTGHHLVSGSIDSNLRIISDSYKVIRLLLLSPIKNSMSENVDMLLLCLQVLDEYYLQIILF